MFGYRAQARTRAAFQASMSASEYGPVASSDLTLTHMTGWLPISDIICLTRAGRLTTEPMATSAVSLVPRASTQQPRSEEHTSELQSHVNLVCRLLLEKKNKTHVWLRSHRGWQGTTHD